MSEYNRTFLERVKDWYRVKEPLWWLDTYKIQDKWLKLTGQRKPNRERPLQEHNEREITFVEVRDNGCELYFHEGRNEFCFLSSKGVAEREKDNE